MPRQAIATAFDESEIKQKVVRAIGSTIRNRGLRHADAAKMGTDQSKIWCIIHDQGAGFSLGRLFRYLVALGGQVDIRIAPGR